MEMYEIKEAECKKGSVMYGSLICTKMNETKWAWRPYHKFLDDFFAIDSAPGIIKNEIQGRKLHYYSDSHASN